MSSFRRRLMMAQGGGGTGNEVSSAESVVGDVCVYGISEGRLMIINNWSSSKYPISKYPPVGIVVVPGSHGHYEGGRCAIMSLNHMNCNTPTTGGDRQVIPWGSYETNIGSLPNLGKVPYVGSNGSVGDTIIGVTERAFLPSDSSDFASVANPYDNCTNYYYNDINKYIPSPHNNDGTFNTEYSRITSPSSTANCLSDFDGYNNTKKIIEVRGGKDYSIWKPGEFTIEDYPAASCCDMYFTPGTKQGDWYLPSAGELGYVVARQQTINDTINKLISSGVTNTNVLISEYYWSSSKYEFDAFLPGLMIRCTSLLNGWVDFFYSDDKLYAIAFALV